MSLYFPQNKLVTEALIPTQLVLDCKISASLHEAKLHIGAKKGVRHSSLLWPLHFLIASYTSTYVVIYKALLSTHMYLATLCSSHTINE